MSAAVACSSPQGLAMQPSGHGTRTAFLVLIPLAYVSSFALPAIGDLPGWGAFVLGLPCCVAAPFGLMSASSGENGPGSRVLLECLSYLSWAANPLLWIGYGSLAAGGYRRAGVYGGAAYFFALSFAATSTTRSPTHASLGPGYWLWVASMALLLIGGYTCKEGFSPRWFPSDEYLREACRHLEPTDDTSGSADPSFRPAGQHEHVCGNASG